MRRRVDPVRATRDHRHPTRRHPVPEIGRDELSVCGGRPGADHSEAAHCQGRQVGRSAHPQGERRYRLTRGIRRPFAGRVARRSSNTGPVQRAEREVRPVAVLRRDQPDAVALRRFQVGVRVAGGAACLGLGERRRPGPGQCGSSPPPRPGLPPEPTPRPRLSPARRPGSSTPARARPPGWRRRAAAPAGPSRSSRCARLRPNRMPDGPGRAHWSTFGVPANARSGFVGCLMRPTPSCVRSGRTAPR